MFFIQHLWSQAQCQCPINYFPILGRHSSIPSAFTGCSFQPSHFRFTAVSVFRVRCSGLNTGHLRPGPSCECSLVCCPPMEELGWLASRVEWRHYRVGEMLPGLERVTGVGSCVRWNKNNKDFGLDSLGNPVRLWVGAQSKVLTASFTKQGPGHRPPPTAAQIFINMILWENAYSVLLVKFCSPCFEGPGFTCRRMNGNSYDCIHLPGCRSHSSCLWKQECRAGSVLETAEFGAGSKETHVWSQEVWRKQLLQGTGRLRPQKWPRLGRGAGTWQIDPSHLLIFASN